MSITHGEIVRDLETPLDSSAYVGDLLRQASDDYRLVYSQPVEKAGDHLSWDDDYAKRLINNGETEKAANFIAIKFLVWCSESIESGDGKSVYVPADSYLYQQVNNRLRYHLGMLIDEINGVNSSYYPLKKIDWQNQNEYVQYTKETGKCDELGIIVDSMGNVTRRVNCTYTFNSEGSAISGVDYQFSGAEKE